MKSRSRFAVVVVVCFCVVLVVFPFWRRMETPSLAQNPSAATSADAREDAYRANNLGVALLEQFKHREGAEQFRRALKIEPRLAMARINLAVALLYVPDAVNSRKEALAAVAAAPDAPQPHYVLGLLSKSENKTEEALASFQRVLKIDPRDVGANVNLGQLYAQQRRYPEAIAAYRTALEEEPYNGTALYNLGTALLRGGQREEGQRMMEHFQKLRQSGAATTIGQNYLEQGRYAEAISSTGAEPDVVDKRTPDVAFTDATASVLPATTVATGNDGGAAASSGNPSVWKWGDAASIVDAIVGDGGATLFDYDGDGDLDLFEVAHASQRLYRNDGGKLTDVTAQSGAFAKEAGGISGIGIGAVAGDFDNDEKPDLFVLRYGANALYRNMGGGRFSDITAAAKIPAYQHLSVSAAFVDYDHDGDLDIFVAGFADVSKVKMEPLLGANMAELAQANKDSNGFLKMLPAAPGLLLRNNGDATFTDQTQASKLSGATGHAVAVVPTDYDNRRDVDLLVVNLDAPPALWRNLRDGTFRNVAAEVGLEAKGASPTTTSSSFSVAAAAGDVNKDGFTDFYFGRADGTGDFALSDGKGRFQLKPAPTANAAPSDAAGAPLPSHNSAAAQFIDYDNDGLLDLLSISARAGGLRAWRNTGDAWADVSDKAWKNFSSGAKSLPTRLLASGDVDADGDADLIVGMSGGGLAFARNEGGNRGRSVRVRLAGKVSNRSGVGAKIDARAGSLRQRLEIYAATPAPAPADVLLGIGGRPALDAVRVLWPAGIVQTETEIGTANAARNPNATSAMATPNAVTTTVTELDRKPSSCPYLFTWNGERFEFVTDFMGGGELGYWVAPGVRAAPDPDEYVRIRGDQLRERDGRYELRVTNELEEALFMDALKLVAVAHPQGVEVYPNEGLGNPTSSQFKLYATRDARPVAAASDEHGHDVRAKIAELDRQYPDDFKLHSVRGYAEPHTLTLDLGNARQNDARQQTLLLMTGWTDYAFSSDNVAAAQSGMSLSPPALQVKDARGNWRTVMADIGVPVGRPQTVTVDLTGKFLSASREVRIVTNMRIYWDKILVDTSGGRDPVRFETLEPVVADLVWRGFSAETTPDGREPFGYDHARISPTSPWKVMPGHYTREGDVRELLERVDDIFVVSRPGDQLAVSFDATRLAPLPRGWTRTFLLYADGFSKEMDINSASPDQVAPLPFHAMKNYPYSAPEAYPATPARRAYIERYNTRVVAAPLSQQLTTGER